MVDANCNVVANSSHRGGGLEGNDGIGPEESKLLWHLRKSGRGRTG